MKYILEYKNFINENMDIVITIPKNIKWEDYLKEIEKVKDGEEVMNFKVSSFPSKSKVGNKCYLVHNGQLKGWMKIVGFKEHEFTCSTTGKKYKGKFIQRSGKFNEIDHTPMTGFQGYRYINIDD